MLLSSRIMLILAGFLIVTGAAACQPQPADEQELSVLLVKGPDGSISSQPLVTVPGLDYSCDSETNTCTCTGQADCDKMKEDWLDDDICEDTVLVCTKSFSVCVCRWR